MIVDKECFFFFLKKKKKKKKKKEGMSGMEHGTDHIPGMTNEMCNMGEDMPPHYCEPPYQVMSSVKGVKISDVAILNDTSVMATVSQLNPISNNTVEDIVVVGGGGDLAGSTILEGNWKQNTTSTLNFEGTRIINTPTQEPNWTLIPVQGIEVQVGWVDMFIHFFLYHVQCRQMV